MTGGLGCRVWGLGLRVVAIGFGIDLGRLAGNGGMGGRDLL